MQQVTAPTIEWSDGVVRLIDQTRLPHSEEIREVATPDEMVAAIKSLAIRGAPAIGVAGAYGVALAARLHSIDSPEFTRALDALRTARPTAVNLTRMVDRAAAVSSQGASRILEEAHAIKDEELAASMAMGELGAKLVTDLVGGRLVRAMTICNTGGLATVERGTALAVIQSLHEQGRLAEALPLETRPLLQGGRLTTWELARMGAPFRLLVDSAAPFLLARGAADVVLIGADRVAANGDVANKIGSFSLALGAHRAGVPLIVVAPESSVDMGTSSGADIEIEDRDPEEVTGFGDYQVAPVGTPSINPAFDITPVDLVTALVTETRIVRFDQGQSLG